MPIGKLRVGKYDWNRKREPRTDGYTNVLIHTTGGLSPYMMRDKDGIIMENFWQMHKLWKEVTAQRQPLSRYQPNIIRWEYPAVTLMDNTGNITPEYWIWREKGLNHHRWIRYPAGYADHSKAVGSVIGTPENYEIIGYIEARKRLYYPKYREIAVETIEFKELRDRLLSGENLQINEVDGPRYAEEYPYNLVVNSSLEMNEDVLRALLSNPDQAFGHGYCLAACLLDVMLLE